jgi:hypothetical protein
MDILIICADTDGELVYAIVYHCSTQLVGSSMLFDHVLMAPCS